MFIYIAKYREKGGKEMATTYERPKPVTCPSCRWYPDDCEYVASRRKEGYEPQPEHNCPDWQPAKPPCAVCGYPLSREEAWISGDDRHDKRLYCLGCASDDAIRVKDLMKPRARKGGAK